MYGTNTELEGLMSERLEMNGRVRFVALYLVVGTYRIDAAIRTRNGRPFDYRRGVIRFVGGSRIYDIGVYRPKHHWKFEGGIAFRDIDLEQRNVPVEVAEARKQKGK